MPPYFPNRRALLEHLVLRTSVALAENYPPDPEDSQESADSEDSQEFTERSGFGRQNEAPNVNTNQQRPNGSPNPSPTAYSSSTPSNNQSASSSSSMNSATDKGGSSPEAQAPPEAIKYFFFEQFAKLGVKGNFMPLAAQPTNVDLGEWLAHQTVEHFRLIGMFIQLIQEVDTNTKKPICNAESCPKMTAGRHSYTWLDHNRLPISVTAHQYISLVQRWMNGKVHDPKAFPTDPLNGNTAAVASGSLSSPTGERSIPTGPTNPQASNASSAGRRWPGKDAGFPETFIHDVRTCFRQIFRIYAHLYHSHWIDPFWHLSGPNNNQGWTDLNSCFVHFCSVAKLYGLLSDKDAEPMQPLIDIWVANGSIPADAANGAHAVTLSQ